MRIVLSVTFGLITLIDILFVLLTVLDLSNAQASNGKDLSFEPVNQVNYKNEKIIAYRTNGGATVDFGIIVRSEKEIFPGLLLTNQLLHAYPMDTVTLDVTNHSILKILDTRENNALLKEVNLDKCAYNFFPAWKEFFGKPKRVK